MSKVRRRRPGAFALLALALLALASLVLLPSPSSGRATGRVVEYWIAAVPTSWNVVPNGRDAIGHEDFPVERTTFRTVVYKQFTRDWKRPLPGRGGIGATLLRARVGDKIIVHFLNLDDEFNRPHSLHFHGVQYRFGSDGAYIPGFSGPGASVKPGRSFTYRLVAGPDTAGVWPFHDHSPSMDDSIAGGLYGALSILDRNERAPDREFVVFLGSQLELMTINGRAFVGNTPVFRAKVGDVVRWDVLTLGDDFHTFHVHGHRWVRSGEPEDTRTIGPAESFAVRWREDRPGTWLYHCHVEEHMTTGMIGIYRVRR